MSELSKHCGFPHQKSQNYDTQLKYDTVGMFVFILSGVISI